ncbi:hypothetical protein [Paenibacillus tarimensis]|nr:hypothetical protein [Paenibacillus tarimensis]
MRESFSSPDKWIGIGFITFAALFVITGVLLLAALQTGYIRLN